MVEEGGRPRSLEQGAVVCPGGLEQRTKHLAEPEETRRLQVRTRGLRRGAAGRAASGSHVLQVSRSKLVAD